jgi:hypothetical protein
MPDLNDLLEKADRVGDSAKAVIEEPEIARFAGVVARLRSRALYPEEAIVVALAGGTGSGKSSLFNAILSEPVAEVGGLRPTTGQALASIPRVHSAGLRRYLEELEITEVVEHDEPSTICLIDLPDTDSVELTHRATTAAILPRVDVVVWVTDPEKYRDAALHDRYVKPLTGHGGHFIFALNQIDRLSEPSMVMDDFEAALLGDGIDDPRTFAIAAGPPAGPPLGVEDLVDAIRGLSPAGENGLVALAEETSRLAAMAEPPEGVSEEIVAAGAVAITSVMASDRTGASRALTEALASIAAVIDGPQAEIVQRLQAAVPEVVAEAAALTVNRPPRWATRRRREQHRLETEAEVGELVERAIVDPVEQMVQERKSLQGLLTDLAISLRSRLDRMSR